MGARSHWLSTTSLALSLAALPACKRPAAPRAGTTAGSLSPGVVEFVGCEAVLRGPVCVLNDELSLSLWVSAQAKAPLVLRADQRELSATTVVAAASGKRYALTLPPNSRQLVLEDANRRRWSLRLSTRRPNEVIRQARSLRRRGLGTQAESLLRRTRPGLDAVNRCYTDALLGRVALARGESRAAADALDRNRLRANELGLLSQAVSDALALSFVLTVNLRQLTRARGVLAEARALAQGYPQGLADIPYYEGLVAWESGDLRAGLRAFRTAERNASRLGLTRLQRNAQQQIALTLASLGRTAEALPLQRAMLEGGAKESLCTRAERHTNLAWIAAIEAQRSPRPKASTHELVATQLARAWQLLQRCPDPTSRRTALINQTLWAVQRGESKRGAELARRLAELKGGRSAQLAIWEQEAIGRAALAGDRPRRALDRFRRQSELAEAIGHDEGRFRARSGIGRASERLGQLARAVSAYRSAETILARWLEWVPFSEGRDAFLGDRDLNARLLVDLLARRGDATGAANAARLARARLLRATSRTDRLARLSPAARGRWEAAVGRYRRLREELEAEATDDWALPADALAATRAQRRERLREIRAALDEGLRVIHKARAAPPDDLRAPESAELQLIYFPGRRGWLGLAVSARGATAKPLGVLALDADLTASRLLEPFRSQIERAGRISVMPYGALRRVDFHALPWGDGPLLAHATVVYATDTSRAPSSDTGAGGHVDASEPATALIVGDPQGDLPHARAEAQRVTQALRARTPRLLLGEQATREATLGALPSAGLLHFAGHATFGGTEGADSALLLHGGRRLSLGDILALERVPRAVVLSACESAETSAGAEVGSGLGLAHAFVAAGSELVIAPVRPVKDRLARAITSGVFARGAISPTELVVALRAAQLRVAGQRPDSDWSSFRALLP